VRETTEEANNLNTILTSMVDSYAGSEDRAQAAREVLKVVKTQLKLIVGEGN